MRPGSGGRLVNRSRLLLGCLALLTGCATTSSAHLALQESGLDPYGEPAAQPRGFSWDAHTLIGVRNTVGGELEEVVETTTPLFGLAMGPAFPIGPGQAISPGLLFLYSRLEGDQVDFEVDVEQAGLSLRYLFTYTSRQDVYLMTDLSYTNLRPTSGGRFGTPDGDGVTAGMGFGFHSFFGEVFSVGGQLAFRYFASDSSTTAAWLDFGLVLQVRL